jgi:hypothetical protein
MVDNNNDERTPPTVTNHEDLLLAMSNRNYDPISLLQMQRWVDSAYKANGGKLNMVPLHDDQYHMTIGSVPVMEEFRLNLNTIAAGLPSMQSDFQAANSTQNPALGPTLTPYKRT